ncbi:hypothetical protein [Saccharopolyspora aridisoli]|uniref:hypothetical protein n=1 Tax=Saccharopolyspora aridisoli TaxID=2530385 RepID=UPI001F1C2D70|nr:hypothetical protein [Saccharopolyspora aridisoli]
MLALEGAWAKANGIGTTDLDEIAAHPEVRAALDEAVTAANPNLARVEQIKTYRVVAGPWTAESGELTPKLSLRRTVIAERYAETIEGMYR